MSDKIFCEKDGDPVEVYPVWNDEYLKNIRIDENYLKGIILQSRGKLKGKYYIITPETCTLVGDTTMKNSAGNESKPFMIKRLNLSDHTLDINIRRCNYNKFNFSDIEDYVSELVGSRDYQYDAIKQIMIYLWGGSYKSITELGKENYKQ